MLDLTIYPGGDLVTKGLADLLEGNRSEEAWLVAYAAPRLRDLGFDVPETDHPYPHHALYEALEDRLPHGAHAAYNALVERMVSFANAYRRDAEGV